jgi:wyosine [tRNA(Phe)-imidazoG37] synthetase (radical SAM superfamily)
MEEVVKDTARQPLLVHRDHRRTFADNLYVYVVVSRRSKGVSIGVNLNPDKVCNFDCVYCQVDRRTAPLVRDVDLPRLLQELDDTIELVQSGKLYDMAHFAGTPPELRRLNDIAFSGDGEPTTCPQFVDVVRAAAVIKRRQDLKDVKLVLITNATRFHQPLVREALRVLDANQGEIWAKLEAGTEEYYRAVDRTTIPFARILGNLTEAAQARPLVIQALFLKMHGSAPPPQELAAFCDRLNEITRAGGHIKLVQVYTVARAPAEEWVAPLSNAEIDALVERIRKETGLAAEPFYAPS